jgi:hypothetical protein
MPYLQNTMNARREGSEYLLAMCDGKGRSVAVLATPEAVAAIIDALTELYNSQRPQMRVDLRQKVGQG